jgi:ABC-type phosphate/phosphonate transport system permease subunit
VLALHRSLISHISVLVLISVHGPRFKQASKKMGNTLLSFFKRHVRCSSVNFGRMTSRMRRFRLYSLVLFLYDMWQIPFITLNIISTITCTDFLLTFLMCIQTVEVNKLTKHVQKIYNRLLSFRRLVDDCVLSWKDVCSQLVRFVTYGT